MPCNHHAPLQSWLVLELLCNYLLSVWMCGSCTAYRYAVVNRHNKYGIYFVLLLCIVCLHEQDIYVHCCALTTLVHSIYTVCSSCCVWNRCMYSCCVRAKVLCLNVVWACPTGVKSHQGRQWLVFLAYTLNTCYMVVWRDVKPRCCST